MPALRHQISCGPQINLGDRFPARHTLQQVCDTLDYYSISIL